MTAIGIAALVLLLGWVFGGFMLRLSGLLLVFAGLLGLALSANADGILIAGIGALLWLLGHGHYSLRHGIWKSRIAGSLWRAAGAVLRRLGRAAAARLGRHIGEGGSAVDDERAEGGG
ncbi:MAG: hypothetical protein AB7V58_00010 [Solirubrobacterales bacterium]